MKKSISKSVILKEVPMRYHRIPPFCIPLALLILSLSGCISNRGVTMGYLSLEEGTLEQVGIDSASLSQMDELIQEALDKKDAPGAVLLIGKDNKIVDFKAYGNRRVEPFREAMTKNTIFDLASCSKVLGTSAMTMLLLQDGKISLETKVAEILPQFADKEKGDVTVWNLLTHTSGLPPYCDWKEADKLRGDKTTDQALIDYISSLGKRYPTGQMYLYSCLNFLTLARVNETVAGESMHSFLKRRIWDPLGMKSTGYLLTPEQIRLTAPTSKGDTLEGVGIVHDPLAHYYKATEKHCPGNAGLFMSTGDMAIMAQLVLNKGLYNNVRIFEPETIDLWTRPHITLPEYDAKKEPDHKGDIYRRALAWINYQDPPYVTKKAPDGSFIGHTGWTGTYIWIDKSSQTFLIFNTNTVHPGGEPKIHPYRKRVTEAILKSLIIYKD